MTRGVEAPLVEELAPRVRRRSEVLTPRQEVVAHPGGTMTRGWAPGYCVRRGLEQVRTAFRLPVVAYHLRRGVTRGALPRGLAALGGVGPLRRVVVEAAAAAMGRWGRHGVWAGGQVPEPE
jgi:hypothetical protein